MLYVTAIAIEPILIIEDDRNEEMVHKKGDTYDEEDFDNDEKNFNMSEDCGGIAVDVDGVNIAAKLREETINVNSLSNYFLKSSYETLGLYEVILSSNLGSVVKIRVDTPMPDVPPIFRDYSSAWML